MSASLGAAVLDLGADVKSLERDMGRAEGATKGILGRIQSSIRNVFEIALGNIVARGLGAITDGIRDLGRTALDAVGNAQRLEMSLKGMLTESLMYEQVTNQQQVRLSLNEEERRSLERLTLQRNVQIEKLAELKQAMAESGDVTDAQRLQIMGLEDRIGGLNAEIDALAGKEGRLATVTNTAWEQTLSFEEAQAKAKEQVADLLKHVEKLAIASPFEQSQVEMVTQIGLSAQMSTEEVKRFTGAFLDYSAAHGIASGDLAFAAEQFLQLKKSGKLLTVDLRQLRRLGIDVSRILGAKMGMSVEEFNAQVEQSPELMDQLFESFMEMAEESSAGAAAEMATSIDGMMSTVSDIVEIGSRKLFRPLVEAVSPTLTDIIEKVSDFITGGKLEEVGEQMGKALTYGIAGIKKIFGGDTKGFYELGAAASSLFGIEIGTKVSRLKDDFEALMGTVRGLAGYFAFLWESGDPLNDFLADLPPNLQGPVQKLGELAVIIREKAGQAFQWFVDTLWPKVQTAFAWVKENIQPIIAGIVGFVGAFLGAGAVVSVIGAIGAVLTTITSPLFLIATAVGVLAAAWQANWWGIQEKAAAAWAWLQPILQQLWTWLLVNIPIAIQKVSEFWSGTLQPALQAFGSYLVDTWWPFWTQVFNGIKTYISNAIDRFNALKSGVMAVGAYVAGAFSAAWQALVGIWQGTVMPILEAVGGFFQTHILPLLQEIGGLVKDGLGLAASVAAGIWQNVLWPALQSVGAYIMETLQPVFETFQPVIDTAKDTAQTMGEIWQDTILPALKSAAEYIKSDVIPKLGELKDFLEGKAGEALNWFGTEVLPLISGGFNAIKDAIEVVTQKIASFRDKLNGLKDKLPWWATPGSPTPLELGLRGIGDALDEVSRRRLPAFATSLDIDVPQSRVPLVGAVTGVAAGGGGMTLSFGDVTINSDDDVETLAKKVVREIQRHQRS